MCSSALTFGGFGLLAPRSGDIGSVVGFLATFGIPLTPPHPDAPLVVGSGLALKDWLFVDTDVLVFRLGTRSVSSVTLLLMGLFGFGACFDAAIASRCCFSFATKESRERAKFCFLRCAAPRNR